VPGMSVAIIVRGELVWSEGFGYADVDSKTPACRDTLFCAASVSKLFTAAAMGRLLQQGRLELDVPIQRYVPTFPVKSGTGNTAAAGQPTLRDSALPKRHGVHQSD